MATPAYLGEGQPSLDNGGGLMGRIGSLFGGATPRYLGEGQPTSSRGILGSATPAYLPAPEAKPMQSNEPRTPCATCPVDPAALAAGCIAIVIPQDAACDREEVAATD